MDRLALFEMLKNNFKDSEVQEICFKLNIDYENLSGTNKTDKIRELIIYLEHRDRLQELETMCQNTRLMLPDHKKKLTSILFLAADPTDASRLRLEEEFREIHEKLKAAPLREKFKLELPRLSVRPTDITQALLDTQPQIVHFSGHGTSKGALCFENKSGQTHFVEPDALAELFAQFAKQVNCVLLNACYSKIQAKAIAKYIEHVIGMNNEISDKAAIYFVTGFYQALGAGCTIEQAYKLGCAQIRLQNISEHLTPIIINKSSF